MAQRPKRSRQWLSRSLRVFLPEQEHPVRLTLEADRRGLHAVAEGPGPLILPWAVAGALRVASHPSARLRRRGGVISLRLDRLKSQLQVQVNVTYLLSTVESQASLLHAMLEFGYSPDLALQRKALGFFAKDLLVRSYPPVRIVFNATDLPRLSAGLLAHPLQFVLQVFVHGTSRLLKSAGKQPRGLSAQTASFTEIIRFLACLADELFSRNFEALQRVQALAHAAGYGDNATAVTKLEAIYFLVAKVMNKTWGYDVEAVQEYDRDFARTYLYPYREQYRAAVSRCFDVPGIWQRLLGL